MTNYPLSIGHCLEAMFIYPCSSLSKELKEKHLSQAGGIRRNRRNFRYAISALLPARPMDSLESGNSETPPS